MRGNTAVRDQKGHLVKLSAPTQEQLALKVKPFILKGYVIVLSWKEKNKDFAYLRWGGRKVTHASKRL